MSQRKRHMPRRAIIVLMLMALVLASGVSIASAATRAVTLRVRGMTCGACAVSIEKALKEADGVVDARVSYKRREAWIKYDDQKITVTRLREIIKSLGFKAVEKKITKGRATRHGSIRAKLLEKEKESKLK